MTYKTLYNNPNERSQITYPWVFWDNAFTDEEIEKMCAYFDKVGVERGTTVGSVVPNQETGELEILQAPNEKVRKSNVMFHNFEPANENTNWIFMRLNWVVEQLNNQFYNFDLNGFDSIQYTEYDDTEGGKYDFHQDTIFGLNKPGNMVETRKLSLVLLLAEPGVDFEGGDFQVNQGQECDASTVEFKKGRVIAFPSWQIHRVTPTTKGKRKSLVLWVTGPKFK
jgi:PKHD-type hydroxylase